MSWLRSHNKLTPSSQWADHIHVMISPRSQNELTTSSQWADHELTMSWLWAHNELTTRSQKLQTNSRRSQNDRHISLNATLKSEFSSTIITYDNNWQTTNMSAELAPVIYSLLVSVHRWRHRLYLWRFQELDVRYQTFCGSSVVLCCNVFFVCLSCSVLDEWVVVVVVHCSML